MIFSHQELILLLLTYKYFLFFPLVMFEGPITTIIAGFLSSLHYMDFTTAYVLAAIADLTSDAGYYALGRFGRRGVIEKYGHYAGITEERVERLERRVADHGGKMLLFGKIADPLSAAIQTTAGLAKMDFKKYFLWNIIITFPKSLILISLGFYFGEAIAQADIYRQMVGIAASVVGVIIIIVYFIYRRMLEKRLDK